MYLSRLMDEDVDYERATKKKKRNNGHGARPGAKVNELKYTFSRN